MYQYFLRSKASLAKVFSTHLSCLLDQETNVSFTRGGERLFPKHVGGGVSNGTLRGLICSLTFSMLQKLPFI